MTLGIDLRGSDEADPCETSMSSGADSGASEPGNRLSPGDPGAAEEIVRRYTGRLLALARSRMPAQLAQRLDPEDVIQSVYRCFFTRARDGRYDLQLDADLWRLLVTITLNKLYNQVHQNRAEKRSYEREQVFGSEDSLLGLAPQAFAREPSAMEAIILADQLEQLMKPLDPCQRRMLELRLQGYTLEEIATETGRGQRTVRRLLEEVKTRLQQLANRDGP